MSFIKNLVDKLSSIFTRNESGIVVKVESAPLFDKNGNKIYYPKDFYGNIPYQITFKTQSGKLVTKISYKKELVHNPERYDSYTLVDIYKRYKPGEKFP